MSNRESISESVLQPLKAYVEYREKNAADAMFSPRYPRAIGEMLAATEMFTLAEPIAQRLESAELDVEGLNKYVSFIGEFTGLDTQLFARGDVAGLLLEMKETHELMMKYAASLKRVDLAYEEWNQFRAGRRESYSIIAENKYNSRVYQALAERDMHYDLLERRGNKLKEFVK